MTEGGRRPGGRPLRRGPPGRSRGTARRMNGLRIAQLANFVGPTSGGMRTAIEHVGQGYVEAGAERIVITPGERDVVIDTELGTVVRMKSPKVGGGYRLITDPWKVIETLERFGPTTVEISDKSTLLPVARWARRNGIGTVLFSHERLDAMLSLRTAHPKLLGGEGAQYRSSVATGVGALYRILSRTYDAVVVTSRYAAAEFDEVTTPLVRIPLGVDLDTFHPSLGEPVDDGVLKLVHAGRLSREKSPHLAVATAAELHRRGIKLRMDVYGTGPHLDELLEIAGAAPVTFHGYVDGRQTLARHLAEADVALSVSPGETFGLAVPASPSPPSLPDCTTLQPACGLLRIRDSSFPSPVRSRGAPDFPCPGDSMRRARKSALFRTALAAALAAITIPFIAHAAFGEESVTTPTAQVFPTRTGIGVTWDQVEASAYRVERKQGTTDWQNISGSLPASTTTWLDESIAAGTTADYRVVATTYSEPVTSPEVKATRAAEAPAVGDTDVLARNANHGAGDTWLQDETAGPVTASAPDNGSRTLSGGSLKVRIPAFLS